MDGSRQVLCVHGGGLDTHSNTLLVDHIKGKLLDRPGLSKSDIDSSKLEVDNGARGKERKQILLLLLLSKQLSNVRLSLDHLIVLGRNRTDPSIGDCSRQNGVKHIFDDTKLGRQKLSGSTSGTLDEALHVVTLLEQGGDISLDDRAIQLVVVEGPSDEKGAEVSQNGTHAGKVKIVSSNNNWHGDSDSETQSLQSNVVQMGLVAGHEENGLLLLLQNPLPGLEHLNLLQVDVETLVVGSAENLLGQVVDRLDNRLVLEPAGHGLKVLSGHGLQLLLELGLSGLLVRLAHVAVLCFLGHSQVSQLFDSVSHSLVVERGVGDLLHVTFIEQRLANVVVVGSPFLTSSMSA